MGSVQNVDVCPVCGEEYWYELDLRTGEYRKLTMCKCDRFARDVEEFLKTKGLWEEFLRFHEERERELKRSARRRKSARRKSAWSPFSLSPFSGGLHDYHRRA
jgi:hypothetical protein